MKKLWMGAVALSLAAAGCGGVTDKAGETRGTAGTSGAGDAAPSMTVRGCVVEGTPAGTYMLRTTEWGEEGQVAGTSGANAPSHDPKVSPEYRLIATGNLDLGRHLGEEVELKGEVADQVQDGRNEIGTSGATPDDDAPPRRAEFFRVTEVEKIAESCSSGDSGRGSGDEANRGSKGESKK